MGIVGIQMVAIDDTIKLNIIRTVGAGDEEVRRAKKTRISFTPILILNVLLYAANIIHHLRRNLHQNASLP